MYVPDSQLVQDDDEMDNSKLGGINIGGEETAQPTLSAYAPHVSISTTKVKLFMFILSHVNTLEHILASIISDKLTFVSILR